MTLGGCSRREGSAKQKQGMDKEMKVWEDTRTDQQKESLILLLKTLKKFHPESVVYGHRDFSSKKCPSFDATKEYKDI